MPKPKDDFKWFGEGFDGFPKRLPEDCVEYVIHIVDSKLNKLETRELLRKIQSAGLKLTGELTKDFIWQREGISLALEHEDGRSFLRGYTNYGDSVEDEWLVVFILRELSRKFPQAWIQVTDNDGQFLLVEAAGVLPQWLNPEVADCRVWLNCGKLLIIGPDNSSIQVRRESSESKSLNLAQALTIIESQTSMLIHSSRIEDEAFHRLQKYPGNILGSLHHAIARIPRKLAYALHENPAYISPAVEALYLRDPIALRPLQTHEAKELIFPPEDFVRVSTKFTKVGYAQLKSQQFDRPKAWIGPLHGDSDSRFQVETDLGMKVTVGFELLMSDLQNQDSKAFREINLLLEDLQVEGCNLPPDITIQDWGLREDDEKWLDINFDDFEKELEGNSTFNGSKEKGRFGDRNAQDNLRKIVTRFEDFLNDEAAGIEGAEHHDEMDEDDEDNESDDDSNCTSDDQDVKFDEDEFTTRIKEMMGMQIAAEPQSVSKVGISDERRTSSSTEDIDHKALDEDMNAMERELRAAGALQLNPKQESKQPFPLPRFSDAGLTDTKQPSGSTAAGEVEEEEDDVDIDYNLAKNLLESFKGQGGVSGPGGNLMGLMGMQMPRDEYERD